MTKFEIFKDAKGEWRWRLVASNGRIIAASGEGYKNRGHALDMVSKIMDMDGEQVSIEFLTKPRAVLGEVANES